MLLRRTTTAAAVLVAVMISVAACGGENDPGPTTDPSPTASSTSPSAEPGGPPAGWEDKFTREELQTYNAALNGWENYNRYVTPIYQAGMDTPEARETLKKYSALWQRDVVELAETYDKGGLRLAQDVEPLWTYAKSITPTYVVIVQCTDYGPLRYTRNGEPQKINKPKHLVTPLLVKMTKPEGHDWLYGGVTLKDKSSCDA